MRTSIATVSLSGSLTEKLTAAARAGFDGVEIFENDLLASPLSPEEVRARCADLGLTIDLYQPMRDIEAVPEDEFARNLRRARHKFEVMARLGCRHGARLLQRLPARRGRRRPRRRAAAPTGRPGPGVRHPGRLRGARLGTARQYVRPRLAHRGDGRPPGARHLSGQLPHPLPGLRTPRASRTSPARRSSSSSSPTPRCSRWTSCSGAATTAASRDRAASTSPGCVQHVMTAGYDGPLSLEVFNDVFRQAEAGPTAVDARRSLLVLQETAGIAALPEPRSCPPASPSPNSSHPTPNPLGALLGALGFARTARHRSKPVDLWRAGRGPRPGQHRTGRPARRHPARRDRAGVTGPGRRRPPRRGPARPGAAPPPRRRGRAAGRGGRPRRHGTLLLRDGPSRTPQLDAPTSGPSRTREAAGHVHRIDHLALTQPWHQFDEAALFHRSVLGLHASESVDVADPYGLFRSRP